MNWQRGGLLALCLAVLLAACVGAAPIPPAMPSPSANTTATKSTPTAQVYLTTALDYIQANALLRERVDWPKVRAEALALARDARTTADTYTAIRYVLLQLGDQHSALLDPETVQSQQSAPDTPMPHGQSYAGPIGYLVLPGFEGNPDLAERYIASGRQVIHAQDDAGTCGWVVDLRRNSGGNMWPMLAVVGPLLGGGEVGANVRPDGDRQTWSYHGGQAALEGQVLASGPDRGIRAALPPVALLTGNQTASAGEAIVVAFRGRPATRTFGGRTYGVPSANEVGPLSDGAQLVLTVARFADRTGRIYAHDERIAPDEPVGGIVVSIGDPAQDKVLGVALDWLRQQPGCAA